MKSIKRALISVYHKDESEEIILALRDLQVEIYATGGTLDFIAGLNVPVGAVETLTGYPAILGGRVKTLHPKLFGGILARRDRAEDVEELSTYTIPPIDLVIVDLYPFEKTVASGAAEEEVIEKIDIGGVSLIRAAAKNHKDVLVVSQKRQYPALLEILTQRKGATYLTERKQFAAEAFQTSSQYDTAIGNYFIRNSACEHTLRYGENPHQSGHYFGPPNSLPRQIHGKELSYNNLLDIEAGIELIADFTEPTVAIIKHNNACGCASNPWLLTAWERALAADPLSAFGGIIITNQPVDVAVAQTMDTLFFEILAAPALSKEALDILTVKKNRIILAFSPEPLPKGKARTLLHGVLIQDRDWVVEEACHLKPSTHEKPSHSQTEDLIFANKIVKHSKSNAIVLAKDKTLLASGAGHTSRIDALRHAIEKAHRFGHALEGAVMASDAFFPFPDCVELAHRAGIKAIVQPGGSVGDQNSIDYCNAHQIAMVCTGVRHFKH
jgi:phosphoribosylaminoimidazolecarboxamide formyltransferase/IMP cyclohydrolase